MNIRPPARLGHLPVALVNLYAALYVICGIALLLLTAGVVALAVFGYVGAEGMLLWAAGVFVIGIASAAIWLVGMLVIGLKSMFSLFSKARHS